MTTYDWISIGFGVVWLVGAVLWDLRKKS